MRHIVLRIHGLFIVFFFFRKERKLCVTFQFTSEPPYNFLDFIIQLMHTKVSIANPWDFKDS